MSPADSEPEPAVQALRAVLDAAAAGITRRDLEAEDAARVALTEGVDRRSQLGRLAEWGIWLSGVQGHWPPRALDSTHLLTVGRAPTATLLVPAPDDVTVTPVDLRRMSSAASAAKKGVAAVDAAVDSGAHLLVLASGDDAAPLSSTVLVALLLQLSAVEVVGDAPELTEPAWAAHVASVRDGTHRSRGLDDDVVAVLHSLGSLTLVTLAAMLLRAAARRTPVLLDGPADTAAALLASRVAILGSWWWFAAATSADPATTRAQEALGLVPLVDLASRLGGGANALTSLSLLRTAADVMRAEGNTPPNA